jgi:hypothetical protein
LHSTFYRDRLAHPYLYTLPLKRCKVCQWFLNPKPKIWTPCPIWMIFTFLEFADQTEKLLFSKLCSQII